MAVVFPQDLIPTKDVLAMIPEAGRPSRSSLFTWSRRGHFPPYYQFSPHKFFWSKALVESWLESRGFLSDRGAK